MLITKIGASSNIQSNPTKREFDTRTVAGNIESQENVETLEYENHNKIATRTWEKSLQKIAHVMFSLSSVLRSWGGSISHSRHLSFTILFRIEFRNNYESRSKQCQLQPRWEALSHHVKHQASSSRHFFPIDSSSFRVLVEMWPKMWQCVIEPKKHYWWV